MQLVYTCLQKRVGRKIVLVGEMLQVVGLDVVVDKIGAEVTHGIVLPPCRGIGQQSVRIEKQRVRRSLIVNVVFRAMLVIQGHQIVGRSIIVYLAGTILGRMQLRQLKIPWVPGAEVNAGKSIIQLLVQQDAADLSVQSSICPPAIWPEGGLEKAADRFVGCDVTPVDCHRVQVTASRSAELGTCAAGNDIGTADADRHQVGSKLIKDWVANINAVHFVIDLILVGSAKMGILAGVFGHSGFVVKQTGELVQVVRLRLFPLFIACSDGCVSVCAISVSGRNSPAGSDATDFFLRKGKV